MLQTLIWTREDMAVAQDWELERGNEGALLWTDLGPELARIVCENPGVLAGFVDISGEIMITKGIKARSGASVRAGIGLAGGTKAVLWSGTHTWGKENTCARAGVEIGIRARARVPSQTWWGYAWSGARTGNRRA